MKDFMNDILNEIKGDKGLGLIISLGILIFLWFLPNLTETFFPGSPVIWLITSSLGRTVIRLVTIGMFIFVLYWNFVDLIISLREKWFGNR